MTASTITPEYEKAPDGSTVCAGCGVELGQPISDANPGCHTPECPFMQRARLRVTRDGQTILDRTAALELPDGEYVEAEVTLRGEPYTVRFDFDPPLRGDQHVAIAAKQLVRAWHCNEPIDEARDELVSAVRESWTQAVEV